MTPSLQGKNNGRQLHILCRVILLVILQLSRTISHNFPGLHQNASQSVVLLAHMITNNIPTIPNHPFVSRTPKVTFLNPSVRISHIHLTTYIIHVIFNTQSCTYNQRIHKKAHNACCDLILSRGLLSNLSPRP